MQKQASIYMDASGEKIIHGSWLRSRYASTLDLNYPCRHNMPIKITKGINFCNEIVYTSHIA